MLISFGFLLKHKSIHIHLGAFNHKIKRIDNSILGMKSYFKMQLMYKLSKYLLKVYFLNTSAPDQIDKNQDETCSGD